MDKIATKVTVTCQECGKELEKQFEAEALFLKNDEVVCDCGKSYLVAKPVVYDEFDETEIRVVFYCKECGSLLNAYFDKDPEDDENEGYMDLDQVECSCGIWYEVKMPRLPTVMKS